MTEPQVDVAVNLLWCVPGDVGGSEEYLVRQLLGLADLARQPGRPESRWRVSVAAASGFAAAHPDLAAVTRFVEPSFSSRSRGRRIVGEATWLRRATAAAGLVHHGGGTAPTGARRPFVLTIHDLQFLTHPQYFSRVKRTYLGRAIPSSVRRATVVTVPSEYVRRSVIDAYGADPDAVMVVPHGIEPAVASTVTPEAELRQRYDLGDGPVLVFPAITHPHKRHDFLLDLLRHHLHDPDLRLVLTGGAGMAEASVAAAATDPRVRRTGRVPAADRNGLLAMAEAMVFPSEYEGFGAPLIEAMTLGCPVVANSATCIPDVVGDAGVVCPLDPEHWVAALDEVRGRRTALVAAGHERAKQFTSAVSGAALSTAYAAAMERA
jgi:alpha-1,3-rhamnosyl/mannosyltransferase